MIDDLLEVAVELAMALEVAGTELVQLGDMTDVPMPQDVLDQLEERDALRETLRRLTTGPAAQREPRLRAAAMAVYREERARATRTDDAPAIPVDADVRRAVEAAFELLRRRQIVLPELREALRGVSPWR